jgi:hypothetical protein
MAAPMRPFDKVHAAVGIAVIDLIADEVALGGRLSPHYVPFTLQCVRYHELTRATLDYAALRAALTAPLSAAHQSELLDLLAHSRCAWQTRQPKST